MKLEETYNVRHDLIGITVSTFSRTEDNLTQDRPSPARLSYRTVAGCRWDSLVHETKWAVIYFKIGRNLKIFVFPWQCMWGFLSFGIWRHFTQHSVPNFSDNLVVIKCQQNIMYWHRVICQKNGIFCTFVWKWWILVFSKPHSVQSAHIIVSIHVKFLQ
jgi:hypothetical protein